MPEVWQESDLSRRRETDLLQEVEIQFIQALADENNDRVASRQPRLTTPSVQRNPDLGSIDFAWPRAQNGLARRVIAGIQESATGMFLCISADVSIRRPFNRGDTLRYHERYKTIGEFLPLDAEPEDIIASLRTAIEQAFSLTAQDLTNERVVTVEHL